MWGERASTSTSTSGAGSEHSTVAAAFAAGAAAGAALSAAAVYYLWHSSSSSSGGISSSSRSGSNSSIRACQSRSSLVGPGGATRPRTPAGGGPQQPPPLQQQQQQQHASLAEFDKDEVLAEHLSRNIHFFGTERQRSIAQAFVVVVGLGGVGSHAAHMLLRSGVGRLRLVDFDQVTLSSLNRHAVAVRADVGIPKAVCLQQHFAQIMPEARVEALVEMCTADNLEQLLAGQPDFVLDAIDNIGTKVALLAACRQRGIPVLCVAGAGAKADPTRLRIVDVSESSIDPLARAVRKRLRNGYGIDGGVPVLLSTERPRCKLVSHVDPASGNPLDYQIVPNFRVRTIPVLGTAPAVFGMAAAAHILCTLASAPFHGEPIIQLEGQQYTRALDRLAAREEEVWGNKEGPAVDRDDMILLLREVYRGFSARDAARVVPMGGDRGLMRSTAHLHFTRWDARKAATVDNLVLLTEEEAAAHDALSLGGGGVGGGGLEALRAREPEFVARVERLLDIVRAQICY